MNWLLVVGFMNVWTAPLFAQAQPNPAKLKAEAQKIVSTINRDKAKTQAYCEIERLAPQIEKAAQERDETKTEALTQKIDELVSKRFCQCSTDSTSPVRISGSGIADETREEKVPLLSV